MIICENWKKECDQATCDMKSETRFENIVETRALEIAKQVKKILSNIFRLSDMKIGFSLEGPEYTGHYGVYMAIDIKQNGVKASRIMVDLDEETGEVIFQYDVRLKQGMVDVKKDFPDCSYEQIEFDSLLETEEGQMDATMFQTKSLAEIIGFVLLTFGCHDSVNMFFENGFREKPLHKKSFVPASWVIQNTYLHRFVE